LFVAVDRVENINIEGSRVLIVDDDRISRQLLRGILERNGLVVDEADCAEAALACILVNEPDLILLDVVMAGVDGLMTCRKLKAMPGLAEVPVIFVTGRADTRSVVAGLQAGGCDYIAKPIHRHEAMARIRNHLRVRVLIRAQRSLIDGLKKANLAKNHIIGVASHDLRNPLASIRGLAEILTDAGPLSAVQREISETIQATAASMLHMVDELLDLSVIESGEAQAEMEPCLVFEIIASSLNIYQYAAKKKCIRLELDNRGMPERLMLDKLQFRRLMDNFLSNAVKYSPFGSFVRVVARQANAIFTIAVEDEGPGIPGHEMHKLFTDFGKTSVQPTGNETSTGLGLAICKKIAESHQARVYAENRTDRTGARFTLELDTRVLAVG
jgi:two-component system sensor histidine kinase/response regulator